MKRYFVTGGVLALCFISMSPAPADDTFSRAVYCTFVMKAQIADNNRTLSSFQNDRSPDPSHLRQWGMQVAQSMDQRYRSDLNRLSTYVATHVLTGDMEQYAEFMVAKKRGEQDVSQCMNERGKTSICAYSCGHANCQPGDVPCFRRCDTQCGAPTCARTDGCMDTSFLPY